MTDWFAELRERARQAMGEDGERVTRLVRSAFEGDRKASGLEKAAVALAGLAAASVGAGLAVTSLLGLALAAAILYVVLTRVFGFDLRLDPATLFGGMWPGAKPPADAS
ncbi:MAG: hypothetical protein JXB32_16040 [Deltaproteobacteria bacterium]|nr:hypothetical protein [Deltaproteobacteria bacterium]